MRSPNATVRSTFAHVCPAPGEVETDPQSNAGEGPALANDFVTDEAFETMLLAWFGNMARVLEPGRSFYIWGSYANCGK